MDSVPRWCNYIFLKRAKKGDVFIIESPKLNVGN